MVEINDGYYRKDNIIMPKYYDFKPIIYVAVYDEHGRSSIVRAEDTVKSTGLEAIVKSIGRHQKHIAKNYNTVKEYRNNHSDKDIERFLEETTDSVVEEVDFIGAGPGWQILGMYLPGSDRVLIYRGLDPGTKTQVLAHELEHRRRAYFGESQDEHMVDVAAAYSTGFRMYRRA